RAAHLRYVGMPGGDRAIREPWRMAVAHLMDADVGGPPPTAQISRAELAIVETMLRRRLNSPWTSSAGRLFDAVAALAGVRQRVRGKTGLSDVVLSGGVFLNALLTTEAGARLRAEGFRVYRHRLVPPSDGGLSLGQLAIAAAQAGV